MSQATYRADLRRVIRGFWNNLWSQAEFQDLMFNAIDRGISNAWYSGAKKVGILPDEITPEEQIKLSTIVFREYSYVPGLSAFVFANQKRVGGKLRDCLSRADSWANRWNDASNQAMLSGQADPKLEWVLGPTEHCSTCLKLAGKVKRASTWEKSGWRPQSRALACGGWRCQCRWVPTDKPLSRGRLPTTA